MATNYANLEDAVTDAAAAIDRAGISDLVHTLLDTVSDLMDDGAVTADEAAAASALAAAIRRRARGGRR